MSATTTAVVASHALIESPTQKHMIDDAVLKATVVRDQADGIRIYGLGIDQPVYEGMSHVLRGWKPSGGAASGPGAVVR